MSTQFVSDPSQEFDKDDREKYLCKAAYRLSQSTLLLAKSGDPPWPTGSLYSPYDRWHPPSNTNTPPLIYSRINQFSIICRVPREYRVCRAGPVSTLPGNISPLPSLLPPPPPLTLSPHPFISSLSPPSLHLSHLSFSLHLPPLLSPSSLLPPLPSFSSPPPSLLSLVVLNPKPLTNSRTRFDSPSRPLCWWSLMTH